MGRIVFNDLWEMYRIKFIINGKPEWESFWALKGINFTIDQGEVVGIIGENGAGKSTILKIIAGMLIPDRGKVEVSGRVSGLLELGAGFQAELTGRDNIYLVTGLFGLTQHQVESIYDNIVNFAAIGKFINAPVKCYSQGMFVRLAFAIAIHIDPDVLLIDDTLAVGDEYFQRQCIKKIFELKEEGKTIVFVTHDTNMLCRLCSRALFIKDGRVIKDGPTDKVMPLYTQMIGIRRGVAAIEGNRLNLIFNNGRMLLNWQDRLLTPNSGVYASFFISDRWYSSLQAEWDVEMEGENKLIATGKFHRLGLVQVWKIELTENHEIKLDIEMYSGEEFEIQEWQTSIMLINEYTNWFTVLEDGIFPPLEDKGKDCQVLTDENISDSCIGVRSKDIGKDTIPALIFEQLNHPYRSCPQILNSELSGCRILQYKTRVPYSQEFFQANHFTYFSGKILMSTQDLESYLKKFQDKFILCSGNIKIIFNNGYGIILYDGIGLSKANHMNTVFFINGRSYASNSASWEVKRDTGKKLIAKGTWKGIPITQTWEIEVNGEDSFLWKIDIEVKEGIDIQEQRAQVTCLQDYKYYFSDYGKGGFPVNSLEIEVDMLQRCIPDGLIGLQGDKNQLPVLSLKFYKELNTFAKIINSDFYNKSRILRLEKISPEQTSKFMPGNYPSFKMEVTLDKKQVYIADNSSNKLQDKKSSFIFDRGSGRIYWDNMELTKKLGFYTSFRSEGRWHDSVSSAIWKTEKKLNNSIIVFGKWRHLPIIQYWEIILKKDGLFEFNVETKINKAMQVDRLQINLMLSERYSQWVSDDQVGEFPLFQNDVNDDWSCIRPGNNKSRYIGVRKNHSGESYLPSVTFSPQTAISDWYLNILNSDIYHRGRLLQYANSEVTSFSGQLSGFRADINICEE